MKRYSDKEKIYLLAAIETLINAKESTMLSNYVIEYNIDVSDRFSLHYDEGVGCEASIAFLTRIKDLETGKYIWGDVFYKPLKKKTSVHDCNASELADKIINGTNEEKIAFIFRPEKTLIKKLYVKSNLLPSYSFFDSFKETDGFGYGALGVGGSILKKVAKEIDDKVVELLSDFDKTLDNKSKKTI